MLWSLRDDMHGRFGDQPCFARVCSVFLKIPESSFGDAKISAIPASKTWFIHTVPVPIFQGTVPRLSADVAIDASNPSLRLVLVRMEQ